MIKRFVEQSVGGVGRGGEPWARMHGTLPLGQQHYHFINPRQRAGEVGRCAHYNHFINPQPARGAHTNQPPQHSMALHPS